MAADTKMIGIRVSPGIDDILEQASVKLGKKKAVLARELMEDKLFDLDWITTKVHDQT